MTSFYYRLIMKNSNAIIAVIFNLCLWPTQSQAQDIRILFSSVDIKQEEIISSVRSIRGNSFSSFLSVRYKDGTKKRVAREKIWGYIEKGKIYRRSGKNFLEIVNQQGLIEYASSPIPNYNVITKATNWRVGPHYFSKTLDSKICSSMKEALSNSDLP